MSSLQRVVAGRTARRCREGPSPADLTTASVTPSYRRRPLRSIRSSSTGWRKSPSRSACSCSRDRTSCSPRRRGAAAGAADHRACLQGRRRSGDPISTATRRSTLTRYRNAPDDSFDRAAGLALRGHGQGLRGNTARLAVRGDNPMLLRRGPGEGGARQPGELARLPAGAGKDHRLRHQLEHRLLPSPAWAKQVFPDDARCGGRKLADAIFAASRVDVDDPDRRLEGAQCRAAAAHDMAERQNFRRCISGTGHRPDRRACRRACGRAALGGQERHHLQPEHPDRGSVHHAACEARRGHVSRTKPLSHQGTLIENIEVTFEAADRRGQGERGEEVLNKVLDTDEGARRLGEVALVPHSSPISKQRPPVLQHAVRRERRLPHRARPVLLGLLRRRPKLSRGDRGARRQQEPHPIDWMIGSGEIDIDGIDKPTAAACR